MSAAIFETADYIETGTEPLNPAISQFVESVGILMERCGVSRIGGRILGLLLVHDQPLSLVDVANLLGVSRASASTNLRLLELNGLAQRVSRPGDRRDYYVGTSNLELQAINSSKQDTLARLAEAAQAALPSLPASAVVARQRLQKIIDFAEFFSARLNQLLREWETYQGDDYSRRGASKNAGNNFSTPGAKRR